MRYITVKFKCEHVGAHADGYGECQAEATHDVAIDGEVEINGKACLVISDSYKCLPDGWGAHRSRSYGYGRGDQTKIYCPEHEKEPRYDE